MSSANRGRSRNQDDLYVTPYYLIESYIPKIKQLLSHVTNRQPVIWEPCAGDGRIARVLKHHLPDCDIICSDIGEFIDLDFRGDFLQFDNSIHGRGAVDMILSNPPFFLAKEVIQHAQSLVHDLGSVCMLERLNFFGTKKRERWLSQDVPSIEISPRRSSFLPTGQCDSIEYGFIEWQSKTRSDNFPRSHGSLGLLPTMLCATCGDVQFEKACKGCDYGYCKPCFEDHTKEACKRNLFGKDSLWYCFNHPEVPMHKACRAKGCSLPFCEPCWAEHHGHDGKAVCFVDV